MDLSYGAEYEAFRGQVRAFLETHWEFDARHDAVLHPLGHGVGDRDHRVGRADVEVDGVLLVGDHRAHPSVQGAIVSAERALTHLNIPLQREVKA